MEEVDQIIIQSLRTLQCEIEEDVRSLKQFSADMIVLAAAKCLKAINNDLEVPSKLPSGMSARYRIGTSLAHHIKEVGYTGEIGYQTFLYSNENDIRKIFMFLIEKVPKETAGTRDEPLSASVVLKRAIAIKLASQMKSPWLPPYLKRPSVISKGSTPELYQQGVSDAVGFHAYPLQWPMGTTNLSKKIPKELRNYYQNHLPVVSQQMKRPQDFAASLLEAHAVDLTAQQQWQNELSKAALTSRVSEQEYRKKKQEKIRKRVLDHIHHGLDHSKILADTQGSLDLKQVLNSISAVDSPKVKASRFIHTEKLQFTKEEEKIAQITEASGSVSADTEEEQRVKREGEIQVLQDELNEQLTQADDLDTDMKKLSASVQQMNEEIEVKKRENQDKEEKYIVKKRTLDLLPDADNNIVKLQSVVDNSAQRLASLATQWEEHRAPLIKEYRELREFNTLRESEAENKLEEMKTFREKMKEIAAETRTKEELRKQLISKFENMPKDVNRSYYTRRILEIVSNIKKQNNEIEKVLIDTKALQKEINYLTGKLDRTFTVTDELVFKDAKKDESVRKAYKHLAALHENCEALITTIHDTGVIMREIRVLEDQIETESKKKIETNLEKITNDHQEMKKENAVLMGKLKK